MIAASNVVMEIFRVCSYTYMHTYTYQSYTYPQNDASRRSVKPPVQAYLPQQQAEHSTSSTQSNLQNRIREHHALPQTRTHHVYHPPTDKIPESSEHHMATRDTHPYRPHNQSTDASSRPDHNPLAQKCGRPALASPATRPYSSPIEQS
jgi:hypothetical protein